MNEWKMRAYDAESERDQLRDAIYGLPVILADISQDGLDYFGPLLQACLTVGYAKGFKDGKGYNPPKEES